MCATLLNSVPYSGPPLDHSQQNETNLVLKNRPSMVFLPQRFTVKELSYMLSDTKNGIAVSGSTASGQIRQLIDSSDISESEEGFLFHVALPDIEKHEKFKCDVQEDGTMIIHGATNTGRKKVHSHNMEFDMHNKNLWQLGELSVFYSWPVHVDPTTLEHMLDNGVLEGLSRRNRTNMDWADQVCGLFRPLMGSFDVSDNDGGFLFCVTLPGVEKNEKFKCDVQEDGTITIHGAMSTGEKKGHSHNMVFDMHVLDNGVLEGLSRRKRSNMADQVASVVAPLNSVPYTGLPFDSSEQNQPLNRVTMLILHESMTVEELKQILSIKGLAIKGDAASDLLGPLIGAFDVSDNDDGFLFRVTLPGVEKNEKFKCNVQEHGTTSTGGKKVHSHNMVFDMHTHNLSPPGDFSVSFKLPAHVDPTTLEHVLYNGALEGVIKKKQV